LAIAAGLAAVMVLSSREAPTPTGLPVIYDLDTYQREMQNAGVAAAPLFTAFDNGDELSEADKAMLRKCALMFDTLTTYLPQKAGPNLDAGRAYLATGDVETAEVRLQQCLNNSKLEKTDIHADGIAEAKRLMSMVRGQQGRWQEAFTLADEAVKAFPNVPMNFVQRASTEIQLNRIAEAKADVAKALALHPQNKRALQLQQLLIDSQQPTPKP
jgi:tetratricopeptide (TPR) repeat protein